MKILAVLVSLWAFAYALPAAPAGDEPCQLQSDLRELVSLLDRDAIAVVLWKYYDDPEVQLIFEFTFSQEFRDTYMAAASQPEIETFGLWMEAQCVDIRPILNSIREYFALPPVHWNAVKASRGGIAAFWEEFRNAIPFAEIHENSQRLYDESPAFAEFVENLRGPEAYELYKQLQANEVFQDAIERLRYHGIDIDLIRDIIQSIVNW